MSSLHIPVMLAEVFYYLNPTRRGVYVDATLGDGGHAFEIYRSLDAGSHLIGIDWDEEVFEDVGKRLTGFPAKVTLIHSSYTRLGEILGQLGETRIAGLLLDLGVSTRHFLNTGRGFSYHGEAGLDMRMDRHLPVTAEDLINDLPEKELGEIIYLYGEERFARRIARKIVAIRKQEGRISSTGRLVGIIRSALPAGGRREKHPARRTFQALRIAVNRELENIESVLPQAVRYLEPGGRLCVIAYHSLEDRLVKRFFKQESGRAGQSLQPPFPEVEEGKLVLLTPKVIKPTPEEIALNPRSRSARLRAAEKNVLKEQAGE